jgi:sugar lactone lactonase YvrE
MAQNILLKRSAIAGKTPDTGSLQLGELAINTYDGKIHFKKSGSVESIEGIVTTNSQVTGSIRITETGSFGSLRVNDTLTINHGEAIISGSALVTNDLTILGAVNARQFNISVISSSVLFQSGSTKFGDTSDDTHSFTGSVSISGSLKSTEIEIQSSGNNPIIDTVDDINGWIYTNKSFSVGAQETAPNGIYFSTDGTNMYIIGSSGDDINQYSLSTAWDISSASYVRLFSVASQDTAPTSLFFSPDGLILYILGDTNNRVFRYSLSTAWDISTTTYTGNSFVVTESTPNGLWFKSDGSIMYVVGTTSDTIVRYNLSTNWDITTATLINSFSLSTQDASPVGVFFTNDGLTFYVVGQTNDNINRYDLSVAFDITTAYYVGRLFLGNQELTPSDLYIAFDENKAFVIGSSSDAIFEYSINNSLLRVTSDALLINANNTTISGSVSIDRNVDISGNTRIFGTITAGTLSGAGSFSSLTSTSTTTLASSTATQTVALGAGATVTNATKTINIGTAGVSGSTTIVNIGSSVVNSRTTGSLFGNWQISGSSKFGYTETDTHNFTGSVSISGSLLVNGTEVGVAPGPNTFDFNLDPEAAGTVNFIEDSTANVQAIARTGSFDVLVNGNTHLSVSASAINVTTGSITANYMHLAKYISTAGDLDFNA